MAKTKKSSKPIKSVKKAPVDKPTAGTAETLHKILGKRTRIKCKNKTQKDFLNLISEKEIVIAAGPPGTGKSYLSIGKALELLQNKTNKYQYLKIVKPVINVDEDYGFIPGDLKEKLEPTLASSMDIIDKIIGKQNRDKLEEAGIISVEPIGFVRGKTFDNTIMIIEEAQNITPLQLKTLLTRIGEDSKYVISGDLNQSDRFKRFSQTGLYDLFQRHKNIDEIGYFTFGAEDIVRNPLISKILTNYDEKNFNDTNLEGLDSKQGYVDLTKDDDDDIIKYPKKNNEEDKGPKDLDEATEGMSFVEKIMFKTKWKLYFLLSMITIR